MHTPCRPGVPNPSKQGTKSELAHKRALWLQHLCRMGGPKLFKRGTKSELAQNSTWSLHPICRCRGGSSTLHNTGLNWKVTHKGANWLHHPCCTRGPQRVIAGEKKRSGTQLGLTYTSLFHVGSPEGFTEWDKIRSGPRLRRMAISHVLSGGVPNTSKHSTKTDVAPKGALWLHDPHDLGGRQRFKAVDKIGTVPQGSLVAASHLPLQRSPTLHNNAQNQKWPTSGRIAHITPAI